MKLILPATAIAAALMLTACGGESADHGNNASNGTASDAAVLENAAGTIENVAEGSNSANVVDALENQVEAVENAAENAEASTANAAH